MDFSSIKATWNGYSTRKKWLIGGGVLLVVAAAGAGQDGGQNGGYANRAGSDRAPIQGLGQGAAPPMGYAGGQEGMPGAAAAGGTMPQGGGYLPAGGAAASGDSPDIMGDYEAREKSKDMVARQFTQLQRDQTDVRDERTGDITTDVPNDVANPAIESGSYSAAPAADVAAAGDGDPQ